MCMEDILIARRTTAVAAKAAITAVVSNPLTQNSKRFAIVIQNIGSNPVWISFTNDVATGNGILLAVSSVPLLLNLHHYGNIITQGLYACADAALTSSLFILDSELP